MKRKDFLDKAEEQIERALIKLNNAGSEINQEAIDNQFRNAENRIKLAEHYIDLFKTYNHENNKNYI